MGQSLLTYCKRELAERLQVPVPASGEFRPQYVRAAGRIPQQRTTTYGEPDLERVAASFGAAPLAEPLNPPVDTRGLKRPEILVRPGLAVA